MYGGLRMWLYESVRPVGGPGWFRKRGFCSIFAMFLPARYTQNVDQIDRREGEGVGGSYQDARSAKRGEDRYVTAIL